MPDVRLERHDTVMVITLDRPHKRNALTAAMMAEIGAAVDQINADPDVCAAIITGSGPAFCAGRDSSELDGVRDELSRGDAHATGQESSALRRLLVPSIAAVNGAAVGAGLGLVLQCDRIVAAASAKLWDGHLANGMITSVASWYLPRRLGIGRALEFATAPAGIPASELAREFDIELVDEPDDVLLQALNLAERYKVYSATLVRQTKAAFQAGVSRSFDETMSVVGELRTSYLAAQTASDKQEQHDGR
jgi:enoyl-CoA hydratase/carnithine racemase